MTIWHFVAFLGGIAFTLAVEYALLDFYLATLTGGA